MTIHDLTEFNAPISDKVLLLIKCINHGINTVEDLAFLKLSEEDAAALFNTIQAETQKREAVRASRMRPSQLEAKEQI